MNSGRCYVVRLNGKITTFTPFQNFPCSKKYFYAESSRQLWNSSCCNLILLTWFFFCFVFVCLWRFWALLASVLILPDKMFVLCNTLCTWLRGLLWSLFHIPMQNLLKHSLNTGLQTLTGFVDRPFNLSEGYEFVVGDGFITKCSVFSCCVCYNRLVCLSNSSHGLHLWNWQRW